MFTSAVRNRHVTALSEFRVLHLFWYTIQTSLPTVRCPGMRVAPGANDRILDITVSKVAIRSRIRNVAQPVSTFLSVQIILLKRSRTQLISICKEKTQLAADYNHSSSTPV